ncbi:spermatogenesis-associated protein 22 [Scleropages formosus]|uniref:Spermatogenesis associated 22 n=1 Tax=Scleropages formosus TaxID=113540 RepID=A0A8C9RTV5_SCLFO|nr:spermatogenesis-associated protein 22 [Scleropages formosus]XP_029107300.1 spermatogenesis-associated protein 22 [Scleropages formosus]
MMKRNASETVCRATPGTLSVPLFNQKRPSRLPLTSKPSENEFDLSSDYPFAHSFHLTSMSSGNTGYSKVHAVGHLVSVTQNNQWNRHEYPRSKHLESSGQRGLAPIPHLQGPVNTGTQTVKPLWEDCSGPSSTTPNSFFSNECIQGSVKPLEAYLQNDQLHRQSNLPLDILSKKQKPNPLVLGSQQQNSGWRFKSTSQSSLFKEDHLKEINHKTLLQLKKPELSMKPVVENSLRILTATIEGMKHWSQYKDRMHILFEVFGVLDSAVTIGSHGAKNFLLRDSRDFVQCVFYETDVELPRLIRGHVHRCVGNCDHRRGLLTCMSIRHATPSEQKTAQEAVRASDAEMRRMVRVFSEV